MSMLRHGGLGSSSAQRYAPSALNNFLRDFTLDHELDGPIDVKESS
jgi:hypothetical protein